MSKSSKDLPPEFVDLFEADPSDEFDLELLSDFDDFDDFDDFETDTDEVTQEVARRFAEALAPSAEQGVTLLPAAFERDFESLSAARRVQMLVDLGVESAPSLGGGVTLAPKGTLFDSQDQAPSERDSSRMDTVLSFDTVLRESTGERPPSQRTTLRPKPVPSAPLHPTMTPAGEVANVGDVSRGLFVELMPPDQPASGKHVERFTDLGRLGVGGMGEVRRVFDRSLKRVLAMKILHGEFLMTESIVTRFFAEAQATGQLQHPGIVPVHELGRLADGRWFFTMREVHGKDLGQILDAVHHDRDKSWDLRRLVGVFHKVCETVGYAHTRQVIHRDLKPENILVGDHGEVIVVDWGIARVLSDAAAPVDEVVKVQTSRTDAGVRQTMMGVVAGTPAYMAPEQARGERDVQGPVSDVYALGGILYEILSGHPPYPGGSSEATLAALLKGPPEPLSPSLNIPVALRAICARAMERDPAKRYASARDLAHLVSAWLDGAQRREEALSLLDRALEKQREVAKLRKRAGALRDEAAQLLELTPAFAPVHVKQPAWDIEERARRLEHGADVLEVAASHHARAALERDENLDEAHVLLADMYRQGHAAAEALGQTRIADRNLLLLRTHHRGRYADYLRGMGAVTLHTDPPGAVVRIFRHEVQDRRLVTVPVGEPLTTPLVEVELPFGSYSLELGLPDRRPVVYPVFLHREEHWDGVPPGAASPFPIRIPSRNELGTDDVYIPAGYFWSGGDRRAPNATDSSRVWVDGMVIQRFPVSVHDYLDFLESLVKYRQDAAVDDLIPGPIPAAGGARPFERSRHGVVQAPKNPDGSPFGEKLPVLGVHWSAAMAYARWWREEDGAAWRLPHELEWEKAARGVDGRSFPFGSYLDPTWACMGESHSEYLLPSPLHQFPADVGPYGVRGMAGNARDWCRNQYHSHDLDVVAGRLLAERIRPQSDGPVYRATRGGAWSATVDECRLAARGRRPQDERLADGSIRLVRSFDGGSPA